MEYLSQKREGLLPQFLDAAAQRRLLRQRQLRQQVREGKLSLDEYLRVYVGVQDEYIEQVRPRFEHEIFHH